MIDNETTQLLHNNTEGNIVLQDKANANENLSLQKEIVTDPRQEASNVGIKVAYASGGFVAGVAASATYEAAAATESEKEEIPITPIEESVAQPVEDPEKTEEQPQEPININPEDSPLEHEVIVATDEGIRVAQVDDNVSFAQAFADARSQVGAGGVFEWHGKVYGTYYKDEWSQMTKEERAEWQSKVDYSDVRDNTQDHHGNVAHHHSSAVDHGSYQASDSHKGQEMASNAQMEDETPADGEIKVLGVQIVENDDNQPLTIIGLEAPGGDQALLVDLDNDGSIDVFVHDDNGNNQIDGSEIQDISGLNIEVDDLAQKWAEQNGLDFYSNNDGMPDYSNDADFGSFT